MATSRPAPSTVAPSPSSSQATLPGLDSATSLPASAGGPTPCDSLASPTMPTSGPGHAPANRSRMRARGAEYSTLDIFGQHGSHSSLSVALQSCLGSRLRAEMDSVGSTLFSLTWRDAVTPSGRRICALRASVRRMPDSDCSSWPTPLATDGSKASTHSYRNGDPSEPCLKLTGAARLAHWPTPDSTYRGTVPPPQGMIRDSGAKAQLTLQGAVALASWPTPTTRDWKSSASNKHEDNARPLNEVARLSHWPTPRAADDAKGALLAGDRNGLTGHDLPTVARLSHWATPAAQEAGGTPEQFLARKGRARARGLKLGESLTSLSLQAQLADSGATLTGSSAETPAMAPQSPGQLNPEHSRWLQGYPAGWASLRDTATRSSRK
jgi:hypothetical protein